jgi:hypothetical protein
MEAADYENAVKQIFAAMAKGVHMIDLGEAVVSRGRKGEARQVQPQKLQIKTY